VFDIYGIIDFNRKIDMRCISSPFSQYALYDFAYEELVVQTSDAKFFCLERNRSTDNIYDNEVMCCFLFGYVFTNKKFQSLVDNKPRKLTARNIVELYRDIGADLPEYLKGSFVLVIYDKIKKRCVLVSDQLNVLPVYYIFKGNIFVFSSAIKPLLDSGLSSAVIDRIAIAEVALFDYTLGTRTFYRDITMLDHGTTLTANEMGISIKKYFSFDILFNQERLNEDESFEPLSTFMRENLELHTSDHARFLLSLTGGFDGRANLAMVNRPIDDFLCYSYGMPGSRQIRIPREIEKRLHINYRPVLLDDKFERQYEDCAKRALFYSDGTAPVVRANYPYAFKQLCGFSDMAITGLFGSEVLKPVRNLGIQINRNSEQLFMSKDVDAALKCILKRERTRRYVQPVLFDESYEVIREYFWQCYFGAHQNIDALTRFYIFFIGEGVRKYFMQEVRIERVYVTTRFPYWDFDLVEFLYKTPFVGLYNGALRQSPRGRRKAQSLYARLIKKYRPELGNVVTDRGYKPNDLLAPFFYIRVLPSYVRAKCKTRYATNDTFDSERWTEIIFSQHHDLMKKETDVFTGSMYEKYCKGDNLRNNYRFSRMFSLKYWFENPL